MVLPARGGLTIKPRWPKPIGTIKSTTRIFNSSASVSSTMRLSGCSGVRSSKKTLLRKLVRIVEVDGLNAQQCKVPFVFLRRPNLPSDRDAGSQSKAANLARRNVNVVGAGKVVVIGTAQKTETIGQDLQRPFAEHQPIELYALFQILKIRSCRLMPVISAMFSLRACSMSCVIGIRCSSAMWMSPCLIWL